VVLLEALEPEADFERIAEQVAAIAPPLTQAHAVGVSGIGNLADGSVLVRDFGDDLPTALKAARRFGHRQFFAGQTFWWTIGGDSFHPTALVSQGLPPPTRFAEMLTGSFDISHGAAERGE